MAGDTNTTSLSSELDLLRSILRSDDHLQIQPSGDYDQIRIKLDHDVQLSCFFDSLHLINQSLTLKTVHDLRIIKMSTKCPLNNDQWTALRNSFTDLVDKSDQSTSLYSIVQAVQDQLLQTRITNPKYKQKEKKNQVVEDDPSASNSRFRGADLIFNRLLHDKSIDRSQVIIGYEDRFTGMHEIAFNEFKKVHDHEYGVPMHRIRYYKINGRLVRDRTNKIDVLTGSEQDSEMPDDIAPKLPAVSGLYHFDQILQQWTQDPDMPLAYDDHKTPSTNETTLPEQCHFLTWNVLVDYHESARIHTQRRYPSILETLKTLLPDLICLQEVTSPFLTLLLEQPWLKENNYYLLIMQGVIDSEKDKSYGQLILMKNFRPRAFTISPLDVSVENSAATNTKQKASKEIIVARFDLSSRVTIDLVNLHLHSDLSRHASEKRSRALENFFRRMNTSNYMLIGDFNFGDYDSKEKDLLEKYASDVHDLWKEVYNLEENPGLTFDPSRNRCANITSISQINRRLDRYLIHTLQNLSYAVQNLNMVGLETIPIDPLNNDEDKRINLSDHYALQLILQFHIRLVSHRSALVILPTLDRWSLIESFRKDFDPSFNRWPPHFNLLWPFYNLTESQTDEENILLPLRMLLCEQQSFNARITQIDAFLENNICFMKLDEPSRKCLVKVYEELKQLFPQCCTNQRNSYNPHMTIAQFENEEKRKQAESSLVLKDSFDFPVSYVYILSRPLDNDTTPFRITHQLPLGHILPPLHLHQAHSVHPQLQELFDTSNLYENTQSYQQKYEKFSKLASCFEEVFNAETLHCFSHAFLPYGSFRLGINGNDVDTVFVLNELKSNESPLTSFDKTLLQMKDDPDRLNKYIIDFLLTHINDRFPKDLIYCRKVEALFSIISILFNDQTKVEIVVQTRMNRETNPEEIRGHLLCFIRSWAQQVGLYGQSYGYLGGYSWAVLCAHICHSSLASMQSLSSIEHFSIDDFFELVQKFFSTYTKFPWAIQSLDFHGESTKKASQVSKRSSYNRGAMRIMSLSPPHNNTGRTTFVSTRDLIVEGFQRVVDLLDQTDTNTTEGKTNALKEILQLERNFPTKKIQSFIQLTLSSADASELDEWTGWMRSRLAYFLNECEEKCRYTFQTPNQFEYRANQTEALYSIGFAVDEQRLPQHRHFPEIFQKFLEQFPLYPNRTETMKVSHRIISIHDWNLERMQPKPPRVRK